MVAKRTGKAQLSEAARKTANQKPEFAGAALPGQFTAWFAQRGWTPRAHQLDLLAASRAGRSSLLIAPTGAGKTLAGFLPSLVTLALPAAASPAAAGKSKPRPHAIHTLYISPLKALAVDVARNLYAPVADMGLDIRIETRTGDTPASRRQRQRVAPPDMLLTTPEQLALLLSHADSEQLFAGLSTIILDELHALVTSKRGDLLSLGLARLRRIAPNVVMVGLSATVARPSELRAYLAPQPLDGAQCDLAGLIVAKGGAKPHITILDSAERVPWAGHSALYALPEIYAAIQAHRTTLVFVNTRSQAEQMFQNLWRINEDNLAIALHHGSLDVAQRRKIEAAMAARRLRAVVATSTLELGIDWGDVDLVVHVGAPKGASRLAQRIGRANHRLDEPSHAILVPSNRFEVLECRAALEAASEGAQDTPPARTGGLDVLAQHVLGMACAQPFLPDALFAEVRSASPYAQLTRDQFDRVVDFVATGGYTLKVYDRYARLRQNSDGLMRISHPSVAQRYRMNVGTIIEAPMLKVRLTRGGAPARRNGRPGLHNGALAGGRVLGELEEWFIEQLAVGDTFVFAGEVVRFVGLRDTEAFVTRAHGAEPKVPSYQGGKFPLSTYLAERVRALLADPRGWPALPPQVSEWLELQQLYSHVPSLDEVLVETFPRGSRNYLVCYPFEGRLAHQTLGMLLTRRLERAGARPLGFVANEYGLAVSGLGDLSRMIAGRRLDLDALFDQDMLGDDLDAWLAASSLMKRTFRMAAVIAGLIERRHPGQEKSGRQITVSSDLIYDVLRAHEPGHILLEAAWADAATGLLDIRRLSDFLARAKGRIRHKPLERVSPLAVPVMLEIGRERVTGAAIDDLLKVASGQMLDEARGVPVTPAVTAPPPPIRSRVSR